MDSTAVNYDSYANVNSNTWCIPVIYGCMMPTTLHPSTQYLSLLNNPSGIQPYESNQASSRKHLKDGLSLNYNPLATVDSKRHTSENEYGCILEREGCMDSMAANYDPKATKPTYCWPDRYGCLHPAALNYGCPNKFVYTPTGYQYKNGLQLTPCTFERDITLEATFQNTPTYTETADGTLVQSTGEAPGLADFYPTIYNGISAPPGVSLVTKHQRVICNFAPGPPPPPPMTYNANSRFYVKIEIGTAEDPSYTTQESTKNTVIIKLETAAGVVLIAVTYNVQGGSSEITVEQEVGSAGDQTNAVQGLQASLATTEMASSLLGLTVLYVPIITAVTVTPEDEEEDWPIIVGAVVGSVCGCLLLSTGVFMYMKRKQSKVEA